MSAGERVEALQQRLFGDPPDREIVAAMTLDEKVQRAIDLLLEYEPDEGYYFAFSGGKDSCVCDELLKRSGAIYEKWYSNTTIDPPELIRFIKASHPDAKWINPEHGNMFHRIATRPGLPPTRMARWCCDEYKESSGPGRIKVFGVRAAESIRRAHNWREVSLARGAHSAICPIVYWSDDDVWTFIRRFGVPYCTLYDRGPDGSEKTRRKRLGCVGCMLNPQAQAEEFQLWPKYAAKWEWAVKQNWRNHQGKLRRDGKPYMHSRFATEEDFWIWWLNDKRPDPFREECQSRILWTNEGDDDLG